MRGRGHVGSAASGRPVPSDRLSVLAVADSPIVRQLVETAFAKETDLSIATAVDWKHAERRLRAGRVDVALLCSDRLWPDDEGARAFREQKIPLVVGALDVRGVSVQTALLGFAARV